MLKSELRLILELQKNGRLSYEQLSQRLGVSVPTIHRLFKRLVEHDVLRIQAIPNPFKFGYAVSNIIMLKVQPQKLDEVSSRLSRNRHVNLLETTLGYFNVIAVVFFRDNDELYAFIKRDIAGLDGIFYYELYTIHEMKKRYNHLFPKKALTGPAVYLDDADDKIIRELEVDGRQSYKRISVTTGIPTSTISRRVNYLQKHNVIKICALPNPLMLGFPVHSFIKVEAASAKVDHVCAVLDKHKNVNLIGVALGQYNIMLVVHFPDIGELTTFVTEHLAAIEGVKTIDTIVQAAIKKRFYGWILSEEMVSEGKL